MSDRGSFIDPEWLPTADDRDYARVRGFSDVEIDGMVEEFKLFWGAASGQRARMRNWSMCWKQNVLKQARYGKRNSPAASAASARRSAVVSGMASTFGGEDRGRTLFDLPDSAPRKH